MALESFTYAVCPIMSIESLVVKYKETLEDPTTGGPVRQVLIFAFLSGLCMEYSGCNNTHAAVTERYIVLGAMFSKKLDAAIAGLRLSTTPTSEAVASFIMAVSHNHTQPPRLAGQKEYEIH